MKYSSVQIASAVLLCVFTLPAFAEKCYEESPNMVADGDEYYDLVMKDKLSRKDDKKIKALTRSLKGKWRGKAIAVSCVGTEKNPKMKTIKSKVTASMVDGIENQLVLKAEMYMKSRKSTASTTTHLFRRDNMFNAVISDENFISYGERLRRRAGQGRQFIETTYALQLNTDNKKKKLDIKIHHYISGVLIAHEKWQLTKK